MWISIYPSPTYLSHLNGYVYVFTMLLCMFKMLFISAFLKTQGKLLLINSVLITDNINITFYIN